MTLRPKAGLRMLLGRFRPSLIARSPMTWILLVVGTLHIVGLGWGLPASDGWDNDGVAPRDFLAGLGGTLSPGQFYTYPPVHLVLLAILTLPVSCIALVHAPALSLHDVVGEILKVPYMTSMAYVARLTSLLMSLGLVLHVARIAEELRAHELGVAPSSTGRSSLWTSPFDEVGVRQVGWCAAAFAGVNASLTYYAHTSNLDVPYLFWASWSILLFTRAVARNEGRHLRRAFGLAVLAVGTKDQAYAIFLLSVPVVLAVWLASLEGDWARRARVVREIGIALALAVALFAVVDGALVNPSGFRARLGFLLGRASQDYVEYTADWSGRLGVVVDATRNFPLQYPSVFGLAIVLGLARVLGAAARAPRVGGDRTRRLAVAAVPLLAALSFTVSFNWTARRTDPRFLLPQAVFLAVYGGSGISALVFAPKRALRLAGSAFASVAFAMALFVCASVDANLILDSRYDAEAWLSAHVKPGEVIETYGLNVYMPRMPAAARVVRVGPEPVDKRNPMPGVEEVQAPFEKAVDWETKWIVVSTAWVWRYLVKASPRLGAGRQLPPTNRRIVADEAATQFFEHLVEGDSPFAYAHLSEYDARVFPAVDVHGTTARTIWIYERKAPAKP